MKINILLPFKEKFDMDKASSVSITVKNNLNHSEYFNNIEIFGQQTDKPLFENNFRGIKYSFLSFKSKNYYLADQMIKIILKTDDKNQIIEIHNRPYLFDYIYKKIKKFPISLFFHNDPKTMKGSKSVREREKILERCAGIFCVSKYIRNQFLDGIKANRKKVCVLYNGVDRTLKTFPSKKKEVLFVGRLVSEKGIHLYVDVAKSVAKQFPDWNFGIIGSFRLGDNQNTNSFAYKVIKRFKDIGNQANFYGFKDYNFVQKKMKSTSIIVIPSLWEEPFGLVAAEAMSNGIAIIASKVGGIPEIIKNNGLLIENINHKKLENTLVGLINDKKERGYLQLEAWNNFKLTSLTTSKKLDKFRYLIFQNYC